MSSFASLTQARTTAAPASPVEPLSEPELWTVPTDIDLRSVMDQARHERARAVAGASRALWRGLATVWHKAVVAPFARWRERERTLRELSMLSERELHDIGLTTGMIPYVASGALSAKDETAGRDSTPANENLRSQKVA
jgi:uncharacterized protein YjiS (DUF1127 family)